VTPISIANLLKSTRQYFWKLGFDEVEIPYLNSSLPLEPNIYSFSTVWTHSQAKFYLPTSPEMALKKHLAERQKDCFAIGHCFRDLEAESPTHTKEFLMLEYYLVNKNLSALQNSLKNYLNNFIKLEYSEYHLPANLPDNESDFNQFFLNNIEPNLPSGGVFVTGYPAFLSPLAIPNERFELYINGIEVANGCTENRNSEQIKAAFMAENDYRLAHHLPTHPISADFIANCAKIPPCSGVGLGIQRLLDIINHDH
jgi:elongation factor P--(R)-beta-lysine ligase